jgi:two-component system nitrogen regulation response regulator GlnG/two-component system response regulator HydG
VASRSAHVLVTGESGTGKELVARALHRLSPRGKRALVARNAATLPASLVDAELFGNAPGYPNAGMAERPGLIGQADGSTLFLDEIGELPEELHAHLLRVLDAGEYQRLGEARTRSSDFRFVAATNRGAESLKADLAARLALGIVVPGLGERREDIPLLARHIVQKIASTDRELEQRFLSGAAGGARGEPCFSSELICALTRHEYSTHVRELEGLLWRSLQASAQGVLEHTGEVQDLLRPTSRPARAPEDISPEELRAALARHGGVKEHAWRELGLSSRYALIRLMRKLGQA